MIGCISSIFLLNSPLHPWINRESPTDSSVFRTIAMMMDRGYMPYVDSFDHKGPFLYILEYIGYKLSPTNGIWFIELISLTATLSILYRVARLFTNKLTSFVITLLALTTLNRYFQGGNYTEEFALPFISISLFIFIDYFANSTINKLRLTICGLSFAIIIMLRPNMIAVWIAFITIIFFKLLFQKEYKNLSYYIIWFIIGALIIALPIFFWLASNQAVRACYDCLIKFNSMYSSSRGGFMANWETFFYFLNEPVTLISVFTIVSLCIHDVENRLLNITFAFYVFVNLILASMGGIAHGHYAMVVIPTLVYPIAMFIRYVNTIIAKNSSTIITSIILIYLSSTIIVPTFSDTIIAIPSIHFDYAHGYTGLNEQQIELRNAIESITSEDDKISVYGNYDYIYLLANRMHATRYSFQFPIGDVNPTILDEYFEQLAEEMPKVIIVTDTYKDNERINNFVNTYNYSWIYSSDNAIVFQKQI